MKKNLLSILDLSSEEIYSLLDRASVLKQLQKDGVPHHPLSGKTLGLLFEKSSTRTRVSFEVGAYQLGGNTIFLSPRDTQFGRGEPIPDSARVLSSYLDGIVVRTFSQEILEEFTRYSSIPVINGLSDLLHPCQVLTDLFTIMEKKGRVEGLKVAWIGDGNNMANAWIIAASRLGFELSLATPPTHRPIDSIMSMSIKENDVRIHVVDDPEEAAKDADVINTDVWTSMGQEDEEDSRKRIFSKYQVNGDLLALAKNDAIVMHCLPAHRGEEITNDVMEGPNSVIFDQAENRLHLQKAILEKLMG